jgi:Flp pilus assembly protein CpaB
MRRRLSLRAAPESPVTRYIRPAIVGVSGLTAVVLLLGRSGGPAPLDDPGEAEPLVGESHATEDTRAPESTIPTSLPVPQGSRTVTVVVPDPLGLAVGDSVDVIVTTPPRDTAQSDAQVSARVVRRATVRSIATQPDLPGEVAVSLIVTPEDVGRVELAARAGTLSLSLTPATDDGVAPTDAVPAPGGSVDGRPDAGDDHQDDE